jgi:hypothetical protein
VFTGVEQLFGEQLAEPTSGLDRPRTLRPQRRRPRQQPDGLVVRRGELQPGQWLLVAVDGDRGVGCLVWVDPDDHCHKGPPRERVGSVTTGTPDEGSLLASFEPRRDRTPTG